MKKSHRIITRVGGGLCLIMVAVFCILPIYDFLAPWPPATQAVAKLGVQIHFCIGMSEQSSTTISADRTTVESSKQRTYILMRAPISWPGLVTISQDQDGQVTVDESAVGFWLWLVVTGGFLWGAWRWFVRHLFFKIQPPDTARESTGVDPVNSASRSTSPITGNPDFCH